jgi:hypothetical protein
LFESSNMTDAQTMPEGIGPSHIDPKSWHRFANPIAVTAIAIFLGLALGGLFGGQPHPARVIETSAATITLEFPEILRNGEFFEMRARVNAKRPVTDLTLGVSASYWRDLTINTMLPAPSEEKSEQGAYRLSYGALQTGETLILKFDGQINPPMFAGTSGNLTFSDGDDIFATVPVKLRVFP